MRWTVAAFTLAFSAAVGATCAHAADAAAAPAWRIDKERAEYTIKVHGYDAVTDLTQDKAGVWRARAWQYNKQLDVQVDQRGNFDVIADLPAPELNKVSPP